MDNKLFKSSLREMIESAKVISQVMETFTWEEIYEVSKEYPLQTSFDELLQSLIRWEESIK